MNSRHGQCQAANKETESAFCELLTAFEDRTGWKLTFWGIQSKHASRYFLLPAGHKTLSSRNEYSQFQRKPLGSCFP